MDVAKMAPFWLLDPHTSPAPVTTSTFLEGDWENPLNYVLTDHFSQILLVNNLSGLFY